METIVPWVLAIIAVVIVLLFILQIVIVPLKAAKKGREGSVWFMVCMLWFVVNVSALLFTVMASLNVVVGGVDAFVLVMNQSLKTHEIAIILGMIVLAVLVLSLVILYMFLPLVVVVLIRRPIAFASPERGRRVTKMAPSSQPDPSVDSPSPSSSRRQHRD